MSGWGSGSQTSLREANRASILDAVARYGGLTQVELAAATGLSAATVSTIVKELAGSGLVEVHPTSRSGRRAQLVTVARRIGIGAGVHIGHRQLRVVLGDFSSEVIAEQVLPLPRDHLIDTTLDRAALLIVDMLDRVGSSVDELTGIGIGVPAPVDRATGRISVPGVLRGWDDESIDQVMTDRLNTPAWVDNDANLAALAESTRGAGRDHPDFLFLRASYGIGSGVVIAGRLHRGYAGTAGEIGHIQVDPRGAICRCGSRGCLDTVVGEEALLRPLRAGYGTLGLRDVVSRAGTGDPGCSRVVADAGETIGAVLAGVCQTLNPQVIVAGGELSEAGEIFLDPMRRSLRRGVLANVVAPIDIVPATLGTRAEVVGAFAMVLDHTDVTHRGGNQR